ncbi:MAG: DUF4838 domain-containing protein, partial [Puniceicoccales bacterium]
MGRSLWFTTIGLFMVWGSRGFVEANPHRLPGGRDYPGYFTIYGWKEAETWILLPRGAGTDQLEEAIEEFQDRVYAMGGGKLPTTRDPSRLLGRSYICFEQRELGEDEIFPRGSDGRFRLRVSRNVLTIEAPDPIGWEFGLYTLLDEYGGVRWYWPGEEGTYTPTRERWKIPYGTYDYEPAYVSREFTGLRSRDEKVWGRRNRLLGTFSFMHNLRRIFDREFFLENPEALAVEWDPADPPGPGEGLWKAQPDLSSGIVVDAAAAAAIEAFRTDPSRVSFALGTNDNTEFGSSPGIDEWTRPMRYFRDLPDYSDLVFQFMNRVADKVSPEFPDRYLGCLAYMWSENVPDFPVHPTVLPYLTADRSQGYDVEFTEEDRELIRRWAAAGPRMIGIYDYIHGAPHPFPRRANLLIGQRIRDSYEAGVRAYRGEVAPIWPFHGDVPWAMARMLWDPALDPGELEAEFLRDFFGPAAAPMGKFYDRARQVWMNQRGSAVWIKYFYDENGIGIYSAEDLEEMTRFLEEARDEGEGTDISLRVASVWDSWQLTLAAANYYEARSRLVRESSDLSGVAALYSYFAARQRWDAIGRKVVGLPWSRQASRTRFTFSDPTYHATRSLLDNLDSEEREGVIEQLKLEALRLQN